MAIYVKVCLIHGSLTSAQCNINQGKYRCKLCQRESGKKAHEKSKEKDLKRMKEYRQNNKEKIKKIKYESWSKNKEKYRAGKKEREKVYHKRKCENLEDAYVKSCIQKRSTIRASEISSDLITIKRTSLAISRKIKQINKLMKGDL